jgi:uncharacterized protein
VIDWADDEGYTALYWASRCDSPTITRVSHTGKTPLFIAAAGDHGDVLHPLLRHPSAVATVHQPDHDGETPLLVSAFRGRLLVVQSLLHWLQANDSTHVARALDHRNGEGETALYAACSQGHAAVVEELLASGADATVVNNKGTAPLAVAEQEGHHECVKVIKVSPAGLTQNGARGLGS